MSTPICPTTSKWQQQKMPTPEWWTTNSKWQTGAQEISMLMSLGPQVSFFYFFLFLILLTTILNRLHVLWVMNDGWWMASGKKGKVVLVLKVWAFSFQGNGQTKYAHEMLHLIHNNEHVWPKEMRYILVIGQEFQFLRHTHIHWHLEISSLIIGFSTHLGNQTHGSKWISCRSIWTFG